jgi:hypothetical protein
LEGLVQVQELALDVVYGLVNNMQVVMEGAHRQFVRVRSWYEIHLIPPARHPSGVGGNAIDNQLMEIRERTTHGHLRVTDKLNC